MGPPVFFLFKIVGTNVGLLVDLNEAARHTWGTKYEAVCCWPSWAVVVVWGAVELICRIVNEGLSIIPVLLEIHAEVCCWVVLLFVAKRSLVNRMLKAGIGWTTGLGRIARLGAVRVAVRTGVIIERLVFGVVSVVVVGNVVILFSWVPGSILIAFPATRANRSGRLTVCSTISQFEKKRREREKRDLVSG